MLKAFLVIVDKKKNNERPICEPLGTPEVTMNANKLTTTENIRTQSFQKISMNTYVNFECLT